MVEFPGGTNFGEGRVGVSNLLDRFYIPQANQAFNFDGLYIAGRGRTATMSYIRPW